MVNCIARYGAMAAIVVSIGAITSGDTYAGVPLRVQTTGLQPASSSNARTPSPHSGSSGPRTPSTPSPHSGQISPMSASSGPRSPLPSPTTLDANGNPTRSPSPERPLR